MSKNREERLELVKQRKLLIASAFLLKIQFYGQGNCPLSEGFHEKHTQSSLRILTSSRLLFIPCKRHLSQYLKTGYREIKTEEELLYFVR